MKITGNNPVPPVFEVTPSSRQAEQPGSPAREVTSDQVRISEDAQWISELRAEAQNQPAIREQLVSDVRAQLADGSFEGSVDYDAVLEGLLADL